MKVSTVKVCRYILCICNCKYYIYLPEYMYKCIDADKPFIVVFGYLAVWGFFVYYMV